MKRISLVFAFSFMAAIAFARSLNIDPNQSGSIVLSTTTASPTQIFVSDPHATRTCIINSSVNNVYFVGFSTTSGSGISASAAISTNTTTGSFYLLGTLINGVTVQATPFCFDGPTDDFTGPVWAVAAPAGATIQRYRLH